MPLPFGPPWIPASLVGTNPGAGSAFILTVPAGSLYHILAVAASLATSATVANRFASIGWFDPAANGAGVSVSPTGQAASTTFQYHLSPTFDQVNISTVSQIGMALTDIVAPETWTFQINFFNLQAGDQISGIHIFYEHLDYV